jgi:TM2 domain-containing membrane protein YozV
MKTKLIAYLLWFFFGGLGAHAFYLNKTKVGLISIGLNFLTAVAYAMFIVCIASTSIESDKAVLLFPTFFALFVCLSYLVLLTYQAFKIPTWVNEANEEFEALEAIKEQRLIDALKAKA